MKELIFPQPDVPSLSQVAHLNESLFKEEDVFLDHIREKILPKYMIL